MEAKEASPVAADRGRWVTFAALMPAARLACSLGLSLPGLKQLVELSYYQEAKRRRLRMVDIHRLMSVSMSKVGLLSKQLKENFARSGKEYGLQRRIMSLLWVGPLSEARLVAALHDYDGDDVRAELLRLVDARLVAIEPARTPLYRLGDSRFRLPREPWLARLDALKNLLVSVVGAIDARFLHDDTRVFARTLAFRVCPEDLDTLRQAYEEHIYPLVCRLDDRAEQSRNAARSIPLSLSLLWAPREEEFPGPPAAGEEEDKS